MCNLIIDGSDGRNIDLPIIDLALQRGILEVDDNYKAALYKYLSGEAGEFDYYELEWWSTEAITALGWADDRPYFIRVEDNSLWACEDYKHCPTYSDVWWDRRYPEDYVG